MKKLFILLVLSGVLFQTPQHQLPAPIGDTIYYPRWNEPAKKSQRGKKLCSKNDAKYRHLEGVPRPCCCCKASRLVEAILLLAVFALLGWVRSTDFHKTPLSGHKKIHLMLFRDENTFEEEGDDLDLM